MELLTPAEVADVLRVDRKVIYAYIKKGELKAGKIGREWRIRRADFDAFLKEVFDREGKEG